MPIFAPLQLLLTPCTVLGGGANLKSMPRFCTALAEISVMHDLPIE